jgi:outer membrane receptor protein involved in Fe transport
MKSFFNKSSLALPLLALVFSTQVFAQAGELEEIIVTAEKREASIQDISIAVTAYSQEGLEARLITDAQTLQFNIPNMHFSRANFSGGGSPRIRGIGNSAIGSAGDSGVGVHINSSYLLGSRVHELQYFDLERVEVLRGPQGTLYGRNTTGGALNVITAKADTEGVSGGFSVNVGNYSAREVKAHVNLPINDELAVRFAGLSLQRDGFIYDTNLNEDVDDRDINAGRFSFSWTPTETTQINFMAQYMDENDSRVRSQKQTCNPDLSGLLGCLPTGDLSFGVPPSGSTISGELILSQMNPVLGGIQALLPLLGYPALPGGLMPQNDFAGSITPNDVRKTHMDFMPTYRAEETMITLEWIQDFGDLTFTSVTGYHDADFYSSEDVDKTVATGDWSPALGYLAGIAGLPALPQQLPMGPGGMLIPTGMVLAGAGGPAAAALEPFVVELVPGSGQALWLGNPYLAQYSSGVPLLGPDGTVTRHNSLYSSDISSSTPEQFTQEIRLQSNFDGDFNFLLGAFYMDYKSETHYTLYSSGLALLSQVIAPAALAAGYAAFGQLPAPLSMGAPGDPYNEADPYQQGFDNDTRDYRSESWAVYGEMYWEMTDRLRATVGLRYSDEEKTSQQRTCYIFFFPCGGFLGAVYGTGNNGYFNPVYEDDKVSWKLNVKYQPSDDTLLYATVSSSFKSGGFNPISQNSPLALADPANLGFGPETIESIEIGSKMTLLNNSMQLNATAFFYDYGDMQTSKIFGVTALNVNTDAEIMGAEVEMTWMPAANLVVALQGSWLDTEIQDFEDFDTTDPLGTGNSIGMESCNSNLAIAGTNCLVSGVMQSQAGNELPGAPGFSYNLGLTYFMPLGEVDLILSTNYYYQDSYWARQNNMPHDRVPSWDVWNASARVASSEDDWYIEAWIKNINDDDFLVATHTGAQVQGLFKNNFYLDPQTYGLTFGYNW